MMKTNSYKSKVTSSYQRLKPKDSTSSYMNSHCCQPKVITRSLNKPVHSKSKSYSSISREENGNRRAYFYTEQIVAATDREKPSTSRYNSKLQVKIDAKNKPLILQKSYENVYKTKEGFSSEVKQRLGVEKKNLEIEDIILKEPYFRLKREDVSIKIVKLKRA